MLIFDLKFTDGKACRYLCPDPEATEQTERAALEAIFCGRLASMVRIIAPPPERLPWKRYGKTWKLHNFDLMKNTENGEFILSWPGGSLVSKERDAISAAVRLNWEKGC